MLKKTKYSVLLLGADGETPREYPVIDIAGYNDGYAMRYKDGGGQLEVVYVPRKYKFREEGDVLLVGKRFGNNSACPIMYLGEPVDQDCPGEDLSAVARSDLIAMAIKTLVGKPNINWKMILIIAGVLIVLAVAIYKFQGG